MYDYKDYIYSFLLKYERDKNDLSFEYIQYNCFSLINLVKDCTAAVKSDILRNKGNVMKRGPRRKINVHLPSSFLLQDDDDDGTTLVWFTTFTLK